MQSGLLEGDRALVTGAARGICPHGIRANAIALHNRIPPAE